MIKREVILKTMVNSKGNWSEFQMADSLANDLNQKSFGSGIGSREAKISVIISVELLPWRGKTYEELVG